MNSGAERPAPATAAASSAPHSVIDPRAAAEVIRARCGAAGLLPEPRILLVLGSGLSGLTERVESPVEIPFSELPGFPGAGVPGHEGRYLAGRLGGTPVLMQSGRVHAYEGHAMDRVVLPVRTAVALGVTNAVFTNAAGGIHRHLQPGCLMLLDDHLNLMWRSALAGPVRSNEERFPDLSRPYDADLQQRAVNVAGELGITLHRGTYAAVLGPSFETPAEVRMLERCGADAVGMSTVPEVITARAAGVRVMAISMITNRAAGTPGSGKLNHEEVLEVGARAGHNLGALLEGLIRELHPV